MSLVKMDADGRIARDASLSGDLTTNQTYLSLIPGQATVETAYHHYVRAVVARPAVVGLVYIFT